MKWLKSIIFGGSKEKKTEPPKDIDALLAPDYSRKSREELLKDYHGEKLFLSAVANRNYGKVPEDFYENLKAIENELINRLPDDFQKSVFRIFARYKFDIVDLMKDDNWRKDIETTCLEICHFLHWGSEYPREADYLVLPFSGHEYLAWLLSQAQGDPDKRLENVFSAAKAMFADKKIFNHDFTEEQLESVAGRLIVIFAGEFAKQTQVLIAIWQEINGGKDFLEGILAKMP